MIGQQIFISLVLIGLNVYCDTYNKSGGSEESTKGLEELNLIFETSNNSMYYNESKHLEHVSIVTLDYL